MEDGLQKIQVVQDIGDRLVQDIHNIILAEQYCAQCQILIRYFQQRREIAYTELHQFEKIRDHVFNTADQLFDQAIDVGNVEVANMARQMIENQKKMEPEAYVNFMRTMLT